MDFKQQYEDAKAFMNDCVGKTVHIFHDSDGDGVGAGFQLYHTLKRLGAYPSTCTHKERKEILSQKAYEKAKGADRILIADVNPVSFGTYELFKQVFPNTPTLILDHHHIEQYKDEIFVHGGKLHDVDGADYCTSKIAYDLCTDVLDSAQDFAWLAAMGIISDMNYEQFPEVVNKALLQEKYNSENPKESEISDIDKSIECCRALGNEFLDSYLIDLQKCETLKQAVQLGNPHPEIFSEFNKYVEIADSQIGKHVITWIYLDTELNLSGWVANTISQKYKEEIIVVYQDRGDYYNTNFRNQSRKVHLGEIAHKCANAVGGSGGGHRPAAGAKVPKNQFEVYQKLVEKEINEA